MVKELACPKKITVQSIMPRTYTSKLRFVVPFLICWAAILKTVAILNLKIPEIDFQDQNTLEFMYWLTICVNFQRIYGILCILIKLRRPFFYADYLKLLKGDSDSPYIFIIPDILVNKIHWKKKYWRQNKVDHVGSRTITSNQYKIIFQTRFGALVTWGPLYGGPLVGWGPHGVGGIVGWNLVGLWARVG